MADKFNPPKDISKMDFKELREEVQLLRDELARMKRGYEDAIYNLDYDNFSSRVMKDQKGMQTSIEQTAEKITLQAEDIKELSTSMSELKITAGEISATVSENYEDLDGKIASNAAKISVTANSISSIVSKNISAYFNSDVAPNEMSNVTGAQKAMLCLYGGKYYYFSDINEKWVEYPAGGLKTMFKQTGERFELTGDVQISGDAVVGGTIKGSKIQSSGSGNHYIEMSEGAEYGAFRIYNNEYGSGENAVPYFSVFDSGLGSVGLMAAGESFILASNVGNKPFASPQGNWNFSACTITDWGNNAPVAVFG